jgi:hypothetical protein
MLCETCKQEVEDKIRKALLAMLDEALEEDQKNPPEDEENSAVFHAQSHGFHYYLLLDWLTKDKKPYFVDPVAEIDGPLFTDVTPATPGAATTNEMDGARKN